MTKSKASPAKAKTADIEEGTVFTPKLDADGLLAVVVTSAETGEVLMLAHMNSEALARTLQTGEAQFWSRSRKRLWRKGEESGNTMRVVEMRTDCDQDALWLKVEMGGAGACCHTGRKSCFYRTVPIGKGGAGVSLNFVDAEKLFDPQKVYGHSGAAKGTLKTQD
ncbi:phosphoribosyl-AMP cyclohydrolase [Methyloceanibacter sp.]|uniref:phosphoribosyl-AMP cyclohydrolase n=1 Tax=Methyloceanibacter sp. TaxID=1965321 RepID=UPI003D6CC415